MNNLVWNLTWISQMSGKRDFADEWQENAVVSVCSSCIVFVVIDVRPKEVGIPTQAYVSLDEVDEDHTAVKRFQHVPCVIGMVDFSRRLFLCFQVLWRQKRLELSIYFAILRIQPFQHYLHALTTKFCHSRCISVSLALSDIDHKGLITRLTEMHQYIVQVVEKKLPVNHVVCLHYCPCQCQQDMTF